MIAVFAKGHEEARYNWAVRPVFWLTTRTPIAVGGKYLIGTNYKCEICGLESSSPVRWFVIHCSDSKLGIHKWDAVQADKPHALHFCGEGHAQVYISRWFESFCGSPVMTGLR
jgi:hypothetical protein